MTRFTIILLWATLLSACAQQRPQPPTDPADLLSTLEDLADIGEKRAGTPGGQEAGAYLLARFEDLGLVDVHFEAFAFPQHEVTAATLDVTVDGALIAMDFFVMETSGSGATTADIVDVGAATIGELDPADVQGKLALVDRVAVPHSSTQYLNLVAAGAAGMIRRSVAPDNLIQVGSIKRTWEVSGPIPAVSIGGEDAAVLEVALDAGKSVVATLDVQTTSAPAMGRNVVGKVPGAKPGIIVVGAHYDTWFSGSADNGSGVAALIGMAARVAGSKPRYTIVFVAYDGEELALYGGYDFLRDHVAQSTEPVLAVFNFEMPSAIGSELMGMGHSNDAPLDAALRGAGLDKLYPIYIPMNLVPQLMGGIIPTDIQGIYRSNIATVSTAVDFPYFHTREDTPDKVDVEFLAEVVDAFHNALDALLKADAADLLDDDPELWLAETALKARDSSDPLEVTVSVTDAAGNPQANADVTVTLFYDDFFPAAETSATTDANGQLVVEFTAAEVQRGSGDRFVHVAAGIDYPLVEQAVAVP